MSIWKRINCNPEVKQTMVQYYNEKGLADVRIYLASWIEERIMTEGINGVSPEVYEQIAHQFYEDLKQKLITLSNDNVIKFKLAEICANITQLQALELYIYVRNGLQRELQLIDQINQYPYGSNVSGCVGLNGNGGGSGTGNGNGTGGGNCGGTNNIGVGSNGGLNMIGSGSNTPIMSGIMTPTFSSSGSGNTLYTTDPLITAHNQLANLNMTISRVFNDFQHFRSNVETFQTCVNAYNQRKPLIPTQETQATELHFHEQGLILARKRNSLLREIEGITNEYESLQEAVINELKNWQHNQALAGNGAPFRDNLDDIQGCIEMLFEKIGRIHDLCTSIQVMRSDSDDATELVNRVRAARQMLVLSSFIVEKQPPQVMKTNTRFAAAVRWLIGPQLGISINNPTVECIILSEAQAQRHSAQRTKSEASASIPSSSGEIINNVGSMEYNNQSRVFSASFRTMQLKKIKRAEKKGTESVMDEKFTLLFYTSVIVNDYRIRVWTLSLPVVVIVHGNQEPQSWATITWDNAFSDIGREPFQVPEKVAWTQLASALNTKFESSTGRALTGDNLHFIYEKLFRHNGLIGDHKDYITWAQFCKEPLPDRSFTFWDWFFAIMKLTKDHLLSLWKAGLIVGFINKRNADEVLRGSSAGTFLLRFSDSELGGITVGLVNDQNTVLMLSPWTARDLNIRCLADRIHDLDILRCVYPSNRSRDDAFGEFYTQRSDETTRRDGYVTNTIRAHVPAIENSLSGGITPQHNIQSPHSQDIQMSNNINDNNGSNDFSVNNDDAFALIMGGSTLGLEDINWNL